MKNFAVFGLLCSAALAAACADPLASPAPPLVACAGPAIPSVLVHVYDGDGAPAGIGATVTITNGNGYNARGKGYGDPVRVTAGENVGGTFDVTVSRPFHGSVTVRNMEAPTGVCGLIAPAQATVVLPLLPGAPAVRQVVTPPYGYGFGLGNMTDRLSAQVVAAPGVSEEVSWVARDSSVIRLQPDGTLRTRCRTVRGSTWAVASSVVDPTKRDSIRVTVDADTHPARC